MTVLEKIIKFGFILLLQTKGVIFINCSRLKMQISEKKQISNGSFDITKHINKYVHAQRGTLELRKDAANIIRDNFELAKKIWRMSQQ